jgi:multiple sugar transport system substrate-binding protein
VWGAGEELVSDDGKRVLFNQPGARSGIRAYFALHRYLPPSTRKLSNPDALHLFIDRQVAATMGPCGWLAAIRGQSTAQDTATLGIGLPPGPPYVGGSNLVIWRHSPHAREGLELVRFLVSKSTQVEFSPRMANPPTRLDALDEPPYSTDPHCQTVATALKTGRPYPAVPRWGLVEERVSTTFVQIWKELLSEPDHDLDDVLDRHMDALASRLEMALG